MMLTMRRTVLAGFLGLTATLFAAGAAMQPDAANKAALKAGDKAPEVVLKDTEGKEHKLSEYTKQGKIVVLEWFNPECPFVKKHHVANKTMANTYAAFKDKNVVWLAINSGAPGKQGAGLEVNKQARNDYKIEYPVLLDETGKTGREYGAKTTPHMYVINKEGIVAYMGAIDSDRSPSKVGDNYVEKALNAVIAGETVSPASTDAYGCNVKYGEKPNRAG